jgi:hypothetical protein
VAEGTPNLGAFWVYGEGLPTQAFRVGGEALFGAWGWQTRLAEALEVDGSTVRRWVSGAVPVPGPVKVAMRLMLEARGLNDKKGGTAPAMPPFPQKSPSKPRSGGR